MNLCSSLLSTKQHFNENGKQTDAPRRCCKHVLTRFTSELYFNFCRCKIRCPHSTGNDISSTGTVSGGQVGAIAARRSVCIALKVT